MYASPLRIVDFQFIIGIFLNGLKTEVSAECKLLPFHSLEDLMNLAKKVEGKNATLSRGFHKVQNRLGPSSSQWHGPPKNSSQVQPNTPKPEEFVGMGNKPRGPKHLCNAEYQEKRTKGLKLMLVEGDALETVEATNVEHQEDDTTLMVSEVEFKLSSSPNNHRSIRVWATIHGKGVRVLIDCGASHNFVAPKIAQELGLEVDVGPQFVVKVADRKQVQGQGVRKGVSLSFLEVTVTEKFFPFPVDEAEFVLGLAWLDKLEEVYTNFRDSCLHIPARNT